MNNLVVDLVLNSNEIKIKRTFKANKTLILILESEKGKIINRTNNKREIFKHYAKPFIHPVYRENSDFFFNLAPLNKEETKVKVEFVFSDKGRGFPFFWFNHNF